MTSYSYPIVLGDGEVIMLEAALGLMLKHCEEQLANGPAAPFIIWRVHANAVLAQLGARKAELRSSNNFNENPPSGNS